MKIKEFYQSFIDYSKKNPLSTYGAITGLVGFLFVGFAVSWWGALGMLIFIWGNNMELTAQRNQLLDDINILTREE